MSSPSHPRALISTEWAIRASSCLGGAGVCGLVHSESFITGSHKVGPGAATSPVLPVLWGFSLQLHPSPQVLPRGARRSRAGARRRGRDS